jgi:hypothetical protein
MGGIRKSSYGKMRMSTAHLRDRIATLLQNIGQTPKKRAIAAGFVFSSRARYEFISDDF